ncbi:MAG: RecQ family ATP-dependent DNA helicase [Treponema sp.]|jgi:ATP-dependent DNA helicase RecQ|nr:RecQ family ATP-dependent DNA helicase [Treponema sp.]
MAIQEQDNENGITAPEDSGDSLRADFSENFLPVEPVFEAYSEAVRDPLGNAVKRLFGLSYLFPYQRLVISNILEAAQAAGLQLNWPEDESSQDRQPNTPAENGEAVSAEEQTAGENQSEEQDLNQDENQDLGAKGSQIVILPTGAGKSLCFQLPSLLLPGPTLVIYPILSLMADQERRLREKGFAPVLLRGGQTPEERDEIWRKLKNGESRFIIANPEVLLTPQVLNKLKEIQILHIVIDEAHCVSEWGESFRPSYLRISEIIDAAREYGKQTGGRPAGMGALPLVTAFTATASAPVLEKIERYVFGQSVLRVVGNPDRSNITYKTQACILRDLAVRDLLLKSELPAIVFCSSRPGTENLARRLRNAFEEYAPEKRAEIKFYHAGLSREEKSLTEKWFLNNSRGILVATCAFGMGVDKADIRTVIHRDCPPSVEAYLQESGRAGRDGLQSTAILLWGPDDEAALRRTKTQAERIRLEELLGYAQNTVNCRREALLNLLNYEGETASPEEHCCDVCDRTSTPHLREEAFLKDFFQKNRRRYTQKEAAMILAGIESLRWTQDEAKKAIYVLVEKNMLIQSRNIFWKNRILIKRDKSKLIVTKNPQSLIFSQNASCNCLETHDKIQ